MHNDTYDNLNLPFPFPDALQEFRVATSGLSAENGTHSGATVNAVTKSGTNRWSGNVFEFLRDHRFNATDYFAPVGADGKKLDDGLNRNQFGGTLGGPILKDRLFFFGGVPGDAHTRQMPPSYIAFVPTAAMMAGDFTAYASPACNAGRPIALRRAVRQQQDRSGALQPTRRARGAAPSNSHGPMRPDQLQRAARQQRQAVRHTCRLPAECEPHRVRPLHRHIRATAADAVTHRQRADRAPASSAPTSGRARNRRRSATRWCSARTW